MADATVREATAAEAAQVASWFENPDHAGLGAEDAAKRFVASCQGEQTLRVLVEGDDILAAVCSHRVAATVGGERVGLVIARGGALKSGRRNASVPILLRGVLRQYRGAAVVCVTGGADFKALKKMGFASWPSSAVRVDARSLPRVPSGSRLRPAFPIDLAALASERDGAAGHLQVARSERDWDRLLAQWRELAAAGARAPEAHVVLRDDAHTAYVIVRPGEGALDVLEAVGAEDAIVGAAGALARGRGLAAVVAPGGGPFGEGDTEVEPTYGAPLGEGVELEAVTADPLSAVDKL